MGTLYCVVPVSSHVLWNSQRHSLMWRHCQSLNRSTPNWKPQRNSAPVGVVSACVLTRGRVCLWSRMWRAEVDFPIMLHLTYRAGLLAEPRWLISKCSQPTCPRDFLSQLSCEGTTGILPCTQLLCRCQGANLQPSHLHKVSSTGPAPHPRPPFCLSALFSTIIQMLNLHNILTIFHFLVCLLFFFSCFSFTSLFSLTFQWPFLHVNSAFELFSLGQNDG